MGRTDGLALQEPLKQMKSRIGATAALLLGTGSTTAPISDKGVASKNFMGFWTKTEATSGDSRGMYWRHYFYGAAGGEAIRAWATVAAANVATGGTVNGIHASMSVNASSSVSGAGNAIRATLGAAAESRTLGGTCAALTLDSDIATGNTVPASWAFMRITKSGSVDLDTFLNIEDDQCLKGSAATGAAGDALKVRMPNGTYKYISLIAAS